MIAFHVGPIAVSVYGLLLLVSLLGAGAWSAYRMDRAGYDAGLAVDTVLLAATLGLIGARLTYIFFLPPSINSFYDKSWFFQHPLDMQAGPLAIWTGGLETSGALIGAGVALWWNARRFDGELSHWFELLLPGLLLFAILLPWGSALNGDLMGPATQSFHGMPSASLDTLTGRIANYHPLPVYVSLAALLLLILFLLNRLSYDWVFVLLMGTWLVVEVFRLDVYRVGGLVTPLQLVTVLALILTVAFRIGKNPH